MVSGRDWSQDWVLPHRSYVKGMFGGCLFLSIDTGCGLRCISFETMYKKNMRKPRCTHNSKLVNTFNKIK